MCIETCPTGAIRENLMFKPGPVKTEPLYAIDNYGGEGVAMQLMSHNKKFVMGVEGAEGKVNPLMTIGHRAKFGYQYLNDSSRITTPMLKKNGEFQAISFKEAYEIIIEKIKSTEADKNMFFAGARMTNEEIYLVQKLAKEGVKSNFVANLHYLGRGAKKYANNAIANVPFEQIKDASKIYIVGADLIHEHEYVGFLVNKARKKNNVPVSWVGIQLNPKMAPRVDQQITIKDYFYFVKALNHYLLSNGLQNQMFIDSRTSGLEAYKEELLKQDFAELVKKSGLAEESIIAFAKEYNDEMNAVIIFSENCISGDVSLELYNLAMITGKLGKLANGLMPLNEKNNAQGIFDMGAFPCIEVGSVFTDFKPDRMVIPRLKEGDFNNIFIFGEDPIGTARNSDDIKSWFSNQKFMLVQDSFMTETAKLADLILPATFPIESAGSFTNTQRIIQQFQKQVDGPVERTNFQQLSDLGAFFGMQEYKEEEEVFMEFVGKLPKDDSSITYSFKISDDDSKHTHFNYGADYLMMRFDKEFTDKV